MGPAWGVCPGPQEDLTPTANAYGVLQEPQGGIMKTKDILSALLSLSIAGIALAETGSSSAKKQPLTLLGKCYVTELNARSGYSHEKAYLYFDADGDTNTTEVVAIKYVGCLAANARVFDAKVGDTKTIEEWRQQLIHQNEKECEKMHKTNHRFDWVMVRYTNKASYSR